MLRRHVGDVYIYLHSFVISAVQRTHDTHQIGSPRAGLEVFERSLASAGNETPDVSTYNLATVSIAPWIGIVS